MIKFLRKLKINNVELFLDECSNEPLDENFVDGVVVNALAIDYDIYQIVDSKGSVLEDPNGESIVFSGNEIEMGLCEWVESLVETTSNVPPPPYMQPMTPPTGKIFNLTHKHLESLILKDDEFLVLSYSADANKNIQDAAQSVPEHLHGKVLFVSKEFESVICSGIKLVLSPEQYERYREGFNNSLPSGYGNIHNPNYIEDYKAFVRTKLGYDFEVKDGHGNSKTN